MVPEPGQVQGRRGVRQDDPPQPQAGGAEQEHHEGDEVRCGCWRERAAKEGRGEEPERKEGMEMLVLVWWESEVEKGKRRGKKREGREEEKREMLMLVGAGSTEKEEERN